MKQFSVIFALTIVLLVANSGCKLDTPNSSSPAPNKTSKDLLITEVFTISPDRFYNYSWVELYNNTPKSISLFDSTRPVSAIVYGANGTMRRTDDNGESYNALQSNTSVTINGLSLIRVDSGIAIGEHGSIFLTADSAKTWMDISSVSHTSENLNSLAFPTATEVISNRTGWVVGDHGTILKSGTRGLTWIQQNSGTTQNLRSVFYVDLTDMWACGDSGIVLHSPNAFDWNTLPSYRTVNFNCIVVYEDASPTTTVDTAYVFGDNGTICHIYFNSVSGAGGAVVTDSSNHTGVTANLRGAYTFPKTESYQLNPLGRVWVVGDNGTILYKQNTGSPWVQQTAPTSANLYSVTFFDSLNGFILGSGGTILRTNDGGEFWTQLNSGTTADLRGSFYFPRIRKIENFYQLEMRVKRKQFYRDAQGNVNFNFYTKIDSGFVYFSPAHFPTNYLGAQEIVTIPAGSFAVFYNDSAKFNDHTKLGPGNTKILNRPFLLYNNNADTIEVKWDLLSSSEVRLLWIEEEWRDTTYIDAVIHRRISKPYLAYHKTWVRDVIRYGNYKPDGVDPYPNNVSLGPIPEWSSIARYANDIGTDDPTLMNTSYSFYICSDPIPGWFSQIRR